MVELLILLTIFWIPAQMVIWRNILWDLYLWQVKEYRFDRMLSHLLSQEEDVKQSRIAYALKVGSLALLLLYFIFPESDVLLVGIVLTFTVFTYESLIAIEETVGKRLIRPKISLRNIIILLLTVLTILAPFAILLYSTLVIQDNLLALSEDYQIAKDAAKINFIPYTVDDIRVYPLATLALIFSAVFTLMLDLVTPLIISFFVVLTQPLAFFTRHRIINKAKTKVVSMKNLKVVGITGSYGKTTTKEMLYQILNTKFKTVKTPQNYNSAVGIAIAVNKYLIPETEIFIAEMGAYTKNEVKDATEIVRPDISIVTGIDAQHITLFGSIENIMKAKYEIIENAKPDAVAILNGDNEYTMRMAEMTSKEKMIYFSSKDQTKIINTQDNVKIGTNLFPKEGTLFAFNIRRGKNGVEFTITHKENHYPVKTNIQGIHNVSNILACIGAATRLGLETKEVIDIINETKFDLPYFNLLNGLNSTLIIDDGYNANSTGFLAALDELRAVDTKNRKHVFTKGIIELGWEKQKVYEKIAKKMTDSANTLVTSDTKLKEAVKKLNPDFEVTLVDSPEAFIKAYNKIVQKDDYILIEGPMSPRFLNEVIDKD